jgi:hypothetical protein
MHGVFSLPDQWRAKIDDPSEQMYQYEVKFHGIHLKGGKMIAREQTEEEKAEVEASKAQKKPAAPAKGQAPPAVDPAVLEQLREDIKARNEKNEQLKEDWESLTNN